MSFVNLFPIDNPPTHWNDHSDLQAVSIQPYLDNPHAVAWKIPNFLPREATTFLREQALSHATVAVGNDGILRNYQQGENIGSYRASSFNEAWADLLWKRIFPLVNDQRTSHLFDALDIQRACTCRAQGVNPLFRYIYYPPATGRLIAHYDESYAQDEHHRTLMTLIVYLTSNHEGSTRFIKDDQHQLPKDQRDWKDWTTNANASDVLLESYPQEGTALLFDHRLLHDSLPLVQESKLVLRTDIMFHLKYDA
jgi:hypothetical protein